MDWQRNRWVYFFKKLSQMRYVRIDFAGNEDAKQVFRKFWGPHPKYLIIPRKALGVALVELPDSFADYLKRSSQLKRKRNRATKLGYTVSLFEPKDHLDEILEVNSSMRERQGRSMDPDYLDRESLARHYAGTNLVFGAFKDGKVRGYIDLPIYGDVCILSRIMGHADHLENGVMYLLVSEVIQQMVKHRHAQGNPRWVMYDTMFGASEGLRFFKEQCGFTPFLVRWRWKGMAA